MFFFVRFFREYFVDIDFRILFGVFELGSLFVFWDVGDYIIDFSIYFFEVFFMCYCLYLSFFGGV